MTHEIGFNGNFVLWGHQSRERAGLIFNSGMGQTNQVQVVAGPPGASNSAATATAPVPMVTFKVQLTQRPRSGLSRRYARELIGSAHAMCTTAFISLHWLNARAELQERDFLLENLSLMDDSRKAIIQLLGSTMLMAEVVRPILAALALSESIPD